MEVDTRKHFSGKIASTEPSPAADFEALIAVADPLDLELRHPVGGAKFSPDLMSRAAGRPPVGVQGRILDALDDGTLTVKEAGRLLDLVNERIRKEAQDGR
jgi:hypothetical protein